MTRIDFSCTGIGLWAMPVQLKSTLRDARAPRNVERSGCC